MIAEYLRGISFDPLWSGSNRQSEKGKLFPPLWAFFSLQAYRLWFSQALHPFMQNNLILRQYWEADFLKFKEIVLNNDQCLTRIII